MVFLFTDGHVAQEGTYHVICSTHITNLYNIIRIHTMRTLKCMYMYMCTCRFVNSGYIKLSFRIFRVGKQYADVRNGACTVP